MQGDPSTEPSAALAPDPVENAGGARQTLVDYLSRNAHRYPHEPAFTFVDYAADPAGRPETVTWSGLDRRVRAVAAALFPAGAAGRTIAVVAPQGIEYVTAFLGAQRAGGVAVPLFVPRTPGRDERLASALRDAAPFRILTTAAARTAVVEFCAAHGIAAEHRILAVDEPGAEPGAEPGVEPGVMEGAGEGPDVAGAAGGAVPPADSPLLPRPGDCAYLQYTSGSTRQPAGVEITHANVVANVGQAVDAFAIDRRRHHIVSWLPLFHDMGLVLAVAIPVVGAVPCVLIDPLAFVQRPLRWLRLLAEHRGAISAAPNFAYDHCVRRVPDPLGSGLALHDVATLINGSEPIRPGTLDRFQQAFGPCGLSPTAIRPSYGLAEATVLVATAPVGRRPRITSFDRLLFRQGLLRPAAAGTTAEHTTLLVSSGVPAGQEVAIVNPRTGHRLADGGIGEIWLRGPNVGRGYWRNAARTASTFGAVVADADPGRPAGPWLRTGDLGALHEGELHVTGRIKDLIIIDGTNHYPQDIEATVQESHDVIRHDRVAAFALADEDGEHLVVVAEHSHALTDPGSAREAAARIVRAAVLREHGVPVHDFVLAAPGTVPRTTSGKIARDACRRHYLSGGWAPDEAPDLAGAGEAE
ncbi:fatty acyl-AMP ligase [Actinacidiphila acididurans]|uniref:Fatty acyl-AMP ligase n=1 Tax=Actinacidiphila acididurans TaxID=2784346 RepID=A0ABS2U3N2_9ACTN|nr:fatty acyl-AMP ligase [Actinacidiphila acididurans]MBM9510201.1 fatty acyl-AMP ligase [Actinacidiphila acididurans]